MKALGRIGKKPSIPVKRPAYESLAGWQKVEYADSLLRFADEMYRDSVVSDRTWAAVHEKYDDRMMIDATATVANYRMVSMALNILGVQINPGEERLPAVPVR